jgi:hypothetical protein
MQTLRYISVLFGLILLSITLPAQANGYKIGVGDGPDDPGQDNGKVCWGNGKTSGCVDVKAGDTAATTAAAIAAASGGVASGNTVTWEGTLSGFITSLQSVYRVTSAERILEKEPPPPPPTDVTPDFPPPGKTTKTIGGVITITTSGTLNETIKIGSDGATTIESHVSFLPGETPDELNAAVLTDLQSQSGLLPAGFSFVDFNGSPTLSASFNYDFSITEDFETIDGSGVPGLFSRIAATGFAPEPSTWMMLFCGFACLGFLGYRRNRGKFLAT